jgi:FtsP/CotA-like multicopper oxidase with cupredoxin domain
MVAPVADLADGQIHNFHVHDVQFQVVRYTDGSPPAVLAGWKDTVLLPPGRRSSCGMRFTDHTDAQRPHRAGPPPLR